jgi:hypothetical protein
MKKTNKESEIIEMKCAVCTKCYRYANSGSDKCHYGGPYLGYVFVEKNTNK